MIEAYNFYLGGYLPKVSPKSNVHDKRELRTKYKNIVSLNNATPLAIVKLSKNSQAYALNVKEMSMELGETAGNVLKDDPEDAGEDLNKMTDIFNKLLKKSDEYGFENNKPSRPGGELRALVKRNREELEEAGFSIDEKGFLSIDDDWDVQVPEKFTKQLMEKSEEMSMNPMEFVEQKVYSYAHLYRNDIGTSYESSMYTGMLFNSYC